MKNWTNYLMSWCKNCGIQFFYIPHKGKQPAVCSGDCYVERHRTNTTERLEVFKASLGGVDAYRAYRREGYHRRKENA